MRKIHLKLAILISAISPLLCSFTSSSGSVLVEYHALTDTVLIKDSYGNNIESQQKHTHGAGHAYCVFHNNYSYAINVGYYYLPAGDSVSIGLWTDGAVGSSSRSKTKSLCSYSHSGVLYNYERCFYTRYERPKDDIYVTKSISLSKLSGVSALIKSKNDTYNVITYNCATFATDVWNHVADTSYYTGWFRAPINIRNEIISDYSNEYFSGNYSLSVAYSFSYYNSKKSTMMNFAF